MRRLTPAGSPPAVRLADRCRPAPACRSAPAPALALRPLTARHAACKWRVAIVATASHLPGYAVPSGTTPAACAPGFLSPATACPPAPPSLRHCAPHGKPRHQGLAARRWLPCARLRRPRPCERPEQSQSGASKLHNEELSAACRLSGSRPDNFRYAKCRPIVTRPPPALAVGLRRLALRCSFPARPPATRPPPKVLPKSRRWRDGELWISRLFSPSLHHECRLAGVRCHEIQKNQRMALSRCRICYLLLTLFVPFFRLLPSSERGRQWHTSKNASTATALPLTGC